MGQVASCQTQIAACQSNFTACRSNCGYCARDDTGCKPGEFCTPVKSRPLFADGDCLSESTEPWPLRRRPEKYSSNHSNAESTAPPLSACSLESELTERFSNLHDDEQLFSEWTDKRITPTETAACRKLTVSDWYAQEVDAQVHKYADDLDDDSGCSECLPASERLPIQHEESAMAEHFMIYDASESHGLRSHKASSPKLFSRVNCGDFRPVQPDSLLSDDGLGDPENPDGLPSFEAPLPALLSNTGLGKGSPCSSQSLSTKGIKLEGPGSLMHHDPQSQGSPLPALLGRAGRRYHTCIGGSATKKRTVRLDGRLVEHFESTSPDSSETLYEAWSSQVKQGHVKFNVDQGYSAPAQVGGSTPMLRTQLASLTKENTCLREKVSELELLQTSLAAHKDAADEEEIAEQDHSSLQATKVEACATVASTSLAQVNVAEDEPCAKEHGSAATKGKGKGKGKGAPPPAGAPSKGDGKGKAFNPRKPAIALNQDMKTLPWRRYMLGSELQEGETIWDKVNSHYEEDLVDSLPKDEIERRFCKNAGRHKVEKMEQKKKPKAAKLDSIPHEQRFQMEVSLKTLPTCLNTGAQAVTAIRELDFSALTPERAASLARFLCPTPEQTQELKKVREQGEQSYEDNLHEWEDGKLELKPEPFCWEPLEEYMEELAKVPACAMRLSCWSFVHDLPDKLNKYHSCLDPFEEMLQCFSASKELPFFLSLVLAFGNYLNGGKNEKRLGRADGFHVELLGRPGGLDVVNDPQGRNLRQLIFKTYFDEHPTKARRLLAELGPLFKLVQRKISKDKDGVPQVAKTVRVQIEDLDKELTKLKTDFNAAHQKLTDDLKLITDPADRFVSEVPKEFEYNKKLLDELLTRKDALLKDFKALLVQFHAETYRGDPVVENGQMKDGNPKAQMTSEVWCRIWDDLFVARQRLLSFDGKKQKEELEPRFCKEAPMSVESLEVLWGTKTSSSERGQKKRNVS